MPAVVLAARVMASTQDTVEGSPPMRHPPRPTVSSGAGPTSIRSAKPADQLGLGEATIALPVAILTVSLFDSPFDDHMAQS